MMEEPTRDSIQLGFMNRDGRLTVAPGLTIPDRLWEVQSRGNAYSVEAVAGGPTALVAASTTGVIVGRNVTNEVEFWPYESLGSSSARLIRSGVDEDESQARFGTVIADGHGRFWVTDAKGQDSVSRNWYRVALDGTVSDVLEMPLTHGLLAARGDTLLVGVGLDLGQVDLRVGSLGVLE